MDEIKFARTFMSIAPLETLFLASQVNNRETETELIQAAIPKIDSILAYLNKK